jgi:hypothetical protein
MCGIGFVALGLVFLAGGYAVAERDISAGEGAPALAAGEEDQLDEDLRSQPILPLRPLVVRPLTPADLPPSNVFAPRSVPVSGTVTIQRHRAVDQGRYREIINREATARGVPPELVDAVMAVESSHNPATVGADGEIGLMQIMPATASMLGFTGSLAELAEPEINIRYGVMYLATAWRLAGQDICTATMKYRAGHGQTRFSFLSVDYCIKVRARLSARGFPVTGTVPQPTFGRSTGGLTRSSRGQSLGHRTSGVDLQALNATLREMTHKGAGRASR